MKLNIALINPNIFGDPNVLGSYRKAKIPTVNLGLGSLAAYIENKSKHNVTIIDARIEGLDPKKAFEKIIEINPDIVGISLCSPESIAWTNPFIILLKTWKPNIHITLGNHFASLFPQKTLNQLKLADSIVIGEGEETFYNLITCISEKGDWKKIKSIAWKDDSHQIIVNDRRFFISDLNTLPIPKRAILKNEGIDCEMVIEGSRGCAYKCSFCTIGPFNGLHQGVALRQRTAKSMA